MLILSENHVIVSGTRSNGQVNTLPPKNEEGRWSYFGVSSNFMSAYPCRCSRKDERHLRRRNETIVLCMWSFDKPILDVLRWTNFRTWLVYGLKCNPSLERNGPSRKNCHMHHPSTLLRTLRYVWQVTLDGRRKSCFPWHSRWGSYVFRKVR